MLTVSDGSVHVKSESCSDNENGALTQDEMGALGSGEDQWPATGDTPPFKDPYDSPLLGSAQSRPGYSQSHTDEPFALSQQPDKGLSAKGSRRGATLDQGTEPGSRRHRTRFTWCTVLALSQRGPKEWPSVGSKKLRVFRQKEKLG